jgi:hypothetical protein
MSARVQDKQSPYVGYFRGNGARTASRLFEPNSHPHVGVYRHAPAKTTSSGLQEILRDKRISLKAKSVISTLQLFNSALPKHLEKKTLELMPTSHFISNRDQCGETNGETPMCPICLEHFIDGDEIRNLKCSHCFHKSCVDIWLLGTMSSDMTTTVCPTCRQDASSVMSEPGTGSSVYSAPEYPTPISTIPAECFLRVGQFLHQEGSKSKTSTSAPPLHETADLFSLSPPQTSPTVSPSLPLPPIAASRSPPLPPLMTLPALSCPSSSRHQHIISHTESPTAAAFLLNSGPPSNASLRFMHSDSSMASSSSMELPSPSPKEPSPMFFPALDDDSTPCANSSSFVDIIHIDEIEINYHILASHDDNEMDMSDSFMTIVPDTECDEGRQ